MATLAMKCPHCLTIIGLDVRGVTRNGAHKTELYLYCTVCNNPSIACIRATTSDMAGAINSAGAGAINKFVQELAETYPATHDNSAPEHSPGESDRVFRQARDAHRRGSLDLAAMGYRRTLELALKAAAPDLKGNLGPRIDQLASKGIITKAIRDWAEDSRVLGNEANHEPPEPTPENVEQLRLFVESLLQYLFTMPEQVRLGRARRADETGK